MTEWPTLKVRNRQRQEDAQYLSPNFSFIGFKDCCIALRDFD